MNDLPDRLSYYFIQPKPPVSEDLYTQFTELHPR